jgi:peptidoglycan/LPS O-acetylase OafA/YrhL
VIFALSHLANPRLSVLCSVCSCLLITSLIYRFVDAPISKRLRGASRIKPSSPMVLVS